jgi:hypothetical protein
MRPRTSDALTDRRLVTIEVFDEEYVALRGTAEVHWFVRVNDAWLHAARHPGAREERLDPAPGTVYRTRLLLDVQAGTRLMRVESRPGAPRRETILEHLQRGPSLPPRRTLRRVYEVDARGHLVGVSR